MARWQGAFGLTLLLTCAVACDRGQPSPSAATASSTKPAQAGLVSLSQIEVTTLAAGEQIMLQVAYTVKLTDEAAKGMTVNVQARCQVGSKIVTGKGPLTIVDQPVGQSRSFTDRPFRKGKALDQRPSWCEITFHLGKFTQDQRQLSHHCWDGSKTTAGKCK